MVRTCGGPTWDAVQGMHIMAGGSYANRSCNFGVLASSTSLDAIDAQRWTVIGAATCVSYSASTPISYSTPSQDWSQPLYNLLCVSDPSLWLFSTCGDNDRITSWQFGSRIQVYRTRIAMMHKPGHMRAFMQRQ